MFFHNCGILTISKSKIAQKTKNVWFFLLQKYDMFLKYLIRETISSSINLGFMMNDYKQYT